MVALQWDPTTCTHSIITRRPGTCKLTPSLTLPVFLSISLMPFEHVPPSQDYPLRRLSTPSYEYFADVQSIGSQDKDTESGDHVRALSVGRSRETVLVRSVIQSMRSTPASELSVRTSRAIPLQRSLNAINRSTRRISTTPTST